MKWKKQDFFHCKASIALLIFDKVWMFFSNWLKGTAGTDRAFDSGRRLVIKLDGGEILGKLITLDAPKPPVAAAEPAPSPEPAAAAPETRPVELETRPDAEKPAPETAPAATPEPAAVHEPEPEAQSTTPEITQSPIADIPAPATPPTPTAALNPDLIEKTEAGDLPVVSKEGIKPWRYYSKPFERKNSQPMVAIIITGMGQNKLASQNALKLAEQVTVAFSPYVRDPSNWVAAARANGHEMLIESPMEAADYPASDPGPQGLLVGKGGGSNEKRLEWQMSRFPGAIGLLTPQGEVFTTDADSLKMLLQSLANRGLLLALGREPHRKDTKELIDAGTTANVTADFLIDEELSPASIQSRLIALEQKAKKQGFAIGVGSAYPVTIEQLHLWMGTLQEKGLILVPVSAIAKLKFS